MGVYLYCIAPAGHAPAPELRGLDDLPVEMVAAGRLALWVSAAARRPEPTLVRIRQHNTVVEAASAGDVTPVPVRFGQWAEEEALLAEPVAVREAEHLATLQRVAGADEYGVRVLEPAALQLAGTAPTSDRAARSGRAYLEARARELAARNVLSERAGEVSAALASELAGLVRETRVEALAVPAGLFSAAHLVMRHDSSGYRARVDAFRERQPELRFLVSGPWPPYSFVG